VQRVGERVGAANAHHDAAIRSQHTAEILGGGGHGQANDPVLGELADLLRGGWRHQIQEAEGRPQLVRNRPHDAEGNRRASARRLRIFEHQQVASGARRLVQQVRPQPPAQLVTQRQRQRRHACEQRLETCPRHDQEGGVNRGARAGRARLAGDQRHLRHDLRLAG
jgi:hypothetical protein